MLYYGRVGALEAGEGVSRWRWHGDQGSSPAGMGTASPVACGAGEGEEVAHSSLLYLCKRKLFLFIASISFIIQYPLYLNTAVRCNTSWLSKPVELSTTATQRDS